MLVAVHPEQEAVLVRVIEGPLIGVTDLTVAGVLPISRSNRERAKRASTNDTIPAAADTLFG